MIIPAMGIRLKKSQKPLRFVSWRRLIPTVKLGIITAMEKRPETA
jgi:hypothetical protein